MMDSIFCSELNKHFKILTTNSNCVQVDQVFLTRQYMTFNSDAGGVRQCEGVRSSCPRFLESVFLVG